jgi:hypothetical protein
LGIERFGSQKRRGSLKLQKRCNVQAPRNSIQPTSKNKIAGNNKKKLLDDKNLLKRKDKHGETIGSITTSGSQG